LYRITLGYTVVCYDFVVTITVLRCDLRLALPYALRLLFVCYLLHTLVVVVGTIWCDLLLLFTLLPLFVRFTYGLFTPHTVGSHAPFTLLRWVGFWFILHITTLRPYTVRTPVHYTLGYVCVPTHCHTFTTPHITHTRLHTLPTFTRFLVICTLHTQLCTHTRLHIRIMVYACMLYMYLARMRTVNHSSRHARINMRALAPTGSPLSALHADHAAFAARRRISLGISTLAYLVLLAPTYRHA